MLDLKENGKLKFIAILVAAILISIIGYFSCQKMLENSSDTKKEENNEEKENNNIENSNEENNEVKNEIDEIPSEEEKEEVTNQPVVKEEVIYDSVYFDIETYDEKLNGQKVYSIELPKGNFSYNDYTTNTYNDNIIFESSNNIPEFSPKLKDESLYLDISGNEYKVSQLNMQIKKIIKGKICSNSKACIQLIALTQDGKIYVNYPYSTYEDGSTKQFDVNDLKFVKVNSDKKFVDVAIVCPETDFALGVLGLYTIVGKTSDGNEYLFGNDFNDKYNLNSYQQDYVHLIMGQAIGVLKIHEDATISHTNIKNVNEVISYNGKPIYFNIGFNDGSNAYVIDRQGYLYTISDPYSNMKIKKGNKKVTRLSYYSSSITVNVTVYYEDGSKEQFDGASIKNSIKNDSRYKKTIVVEKR